MAQRPSSTSTLARQWELLRLLPGKRPGKSAAEITESLNRLGHKVTKRTVERDLQALSASSIFPIKSDERSIPFGWHWMEGASIQIPVISLADAVSIKLIEDYLRPIFPEALLGALQPRLKQANDMLKSGRKDVALAKWPDKVRLRIPAQPLIPPPIRREVLADVQTALLEEKMLAVTYENAEGEVKDQKLHPLGLVQRGAVTYLVTTADGKDDQLLYAIHRMQTSVVLHEPAKPMRSFDLDRYMQEGNLEFGSGETVKLRLWVNDHLLQHLREMPLAEDMKITPRKDNTATIRATVKDSWQLHWWLLSQGSALEVQGPKKLRQSIAREMHDAAARYENPS